MKRHEGELPLFPRVIADKHATELIRVFVCSDGRASFCTRSDLLAPCDWGRILAEVAEHVSFGFGSSRGYNQQLIMTMIRDGFDRELQRKDAANMNRPAEPGAQTNQTFQ